jgi:hypothetical protein
MRDSPPRMPPSPRTSLSSPCRDSSARSALLLLRWRRCASTRPSMTESPRSTPPSPSSSLSCPSSTRSSIMRQRRPVLHRPASSPPSQWACALRRSAPPTAPLGTASISTTGIVDLGMYSPKFVTRSRVRSIPAPSLPIFLPMSSLHRR